MAGKPSARIRTPINADPEMQALVKELNMILDRNFGTRNVDYYGRRIMNAGDAVQDGDYVTYRQMKEALGLLKPKKVSGATGGTSEGEGGSPGGPGQGSDPPTVPLADLSAEVQAYAAAHAAELEDSCVREGGSWAYLDGLVNHLRGIDPRVGWNGKRGDINDPSEDAIAYYHGDMGVMVHGSFNVYVVDVISCHCGPEDGESCNPGAAWNDVTTSLAKGAWLMERPA